MKPALLLASAAALAGATNEAQMWHPREDARHAAAAPAPAQSPSRRLDDPVCRDCFDLEFCSVLNDRYIEDLYTPFETEISGSCNVLEAQASRLDVWGDSKTFRDTDECRTLVLDYTCLIWGAYANPCADADETVNVPKSPCRSYCTEIASLCANLPEWEDLCYQIECPPYAEYCTPGPTDVPVDLACAVFEYRTPCVGACDGAALRAGLLFWGVAAVVGAVLLR